MGSGRRHASAAFFIPIFPICCNPGCPVAAGGFLPDKLTLVLPKIGILSPATTTGAPHLAGFSRDVGFHQIVSTAFVSQKKSRRNSR